MSNIDQRIKEMASEIIEQSDTLDDAMDLCHEYADSLDTVIYYHKAIQFCANENTERGESFIDDTGGFGECKTFSEIACQLAFAEIYCRLQEQVQEVWENEE